MFLLDVIGGVVLGTGTFTILNKLFHFTKSKFQKVLISWLICFCISAIFMAIIVKLIGGIIFLLWTVIKISAICLIVYGVYSGYKKIFRKL